MCLCVVIEKIVKEQEQLRQKCLHLESRLDAAQTECQKEREVRGEQSVDLSGSTV